MMLLPIRFIGAEVRRPEGVTLRKLDAERHPDRRPGFWLVEAVTVRIGAEARRLSQVARPSTDHSSTAQSESVFGQAPEPRVVLGPPLPNTEQTHSNAVVRARPPSDSQTGSAEQSSFDTAPFSAIPYEDVEYAKVPYDSLMRAVDGQDVVPSGAPNEVNVFDNAEQAEKMPWDNDAVESVPYDVLRRVVTDSAVDTFAVVKGEPVFAPPENGGEPYGREVPFVDEEELQLLNDAYTHEHESDTTSE